MCRIKAAYINQSLSKSIDIIRCGFITVEDIAEDMFVHSHVLNDCELNSLIRSQKLLIKIDHASKGQRIQVVRLLNE